MIWNLLRRMPILVERCCLPVHVRLPLLCKQCEHQVHARVPLRSEQRSHAISVQTPKTYRCQPYSTARPDHAHAARNILNAAKALTIAGILALAPACARPAKPLFPQSGPSLVWPPAPDIPRIRYVGEIRGEDSLGAAKTGWQVLRESLTGEKSEMLFSTPTAVAVQGSRVAIADGQQRAIFLLDLDVRTIKPIRTAGPSDFAWPIDVIFLDAPNTNPKRQRGRDQLQPASAQHNTNPKRQRRTEHLAVADARRAAVFVLDADGMLVRTIGHGTLQRPSNLAFDAERNELWVLDAALHAAIAFAPDGRELRRLGGGSSTSSNPGQGGAKGGSATDASPPDNHTASPDGMTFNFPAGLTHHPLTGLAVADSMNFRVLTLMPDGFPQLIIGHEGDAAGDFALPRDVAVDSEGHLYVLDSQFENVQIFDEHGRLLMAFGEEGRGPGQFSLPSGITIDEQDRIWIADTYNRRIQVFQYLKEVAP